MPEQKRIVRCRAVQEKIGYSDIERKAGSLQYRRSYAVENRKCNCYNKFTPSYE
jgi:hypothetical protein